MYYHCDIKRVTKPLNASSYILQLTFLWERMKIKGTFIPENILQINSLKVLLTGIGIVHYKVSFVIANFIFYLEIGHFSKNASHSFQVFGI